MSQEDDVKFVDFDYVPAVYTDAAYEKGYKKGLEDAIKHADIEEVRDFGGDYVGTKWQCCNCGNDVYEQNYCDECGAKLDGEKIYIPKTDCRLCKYTNTGLKEDCKYKYWMGLNRSRGSCVMDEYPHWINKGDYAICSKCGESSGTQYDGVEPIPRITKYCPGCGNKMRYNG